MTETPEEFASDDALEGSDEFDMLAADDGGIIGGIQPDHGGDEPSDAGPDVGGTDTDINDGPKKPGNL